MENAYAEGVESILIIDPTLQNCGIAFPATSPEILKRYSLFDLPLDYARGLPFKLYTPGSTAGFALPGSVAQLLSEKAVISLKGISPEVVEDTDLEKCRIVRDIFKAIYDYSNTESPLPKVLVVLEEANSVMPGGVTTPEAKEMAGEALTWLLRCSREKVKYGLTILLVTQSLADFRGNGRVVRDMVSTRFFFRTADASEMEYVEAYGGKAAVEIVKTLEKGQALVLTPGGLPPLKVAVRPPLSRVGEPSESEIATANSRHSTIPPTQPPAKEQNSPPLVISSTTGREDAALAAARDYFRLNGKPMPMVVLRATLGIKGGGTWQRLIDGLKTQGLIQLVPLQCTGKGRPPLGVMALR